ncbi:AAA family ATPase [Ruminiclostridium herbifermentans]|uniref:AAA family ATPase n=1 Tax=Ruminiclostridium herbifermentans TaxID=2488810 RepID=A0A4U7JI64_9FIRM|nr:AAA family ATPase [Ruminiclostridium herbifermentans]QNU67012.1 AAA family ATPase [Ruminiclostridium herbifermentans]
MKIKKLHVRGFGKIEDFDMTLCDGLNVIYGPNESGKSTLMAFIKAIVYGLKGGRTGRDGTIPEIKRYKPWSNSAYGGYINFELDNGKSFRIDRDFDNGAVKLYDHSFNEITNDYTNSKDGSGIAENLFGVNENIFERTVYIKQFGTRLDNSASKDLIDRISNLRESGTEDISFKKADAALKDALKKQVGTDRSSVRPLDVISRRLEDLQKIKLRIQERDDRLKATISNKEKLTLEINKLSEKVKLFSKLLELSEAKERMKLQKERSEEISFLNERISYYQRELNTLDRDKCKLEESIAENSNKICTLNEQLRDNNKAETSTEIAKAVKKHKSIKIALSTCTIVSIIAVLVVICLSFAFCLLEKLYISIPAILTFIFSICWALNNRNLKKTKEKQSMYSEKLKELKNQYDNMVRIDNILKQQLESLNTRISTEREQYESLNKRLRTHSLSFKQLDISELECEIDRLSEGILFLNLEVNEYLSGAEKELYYNVIENSSSNESTKIAELKEFLSAQLQKKLIEKAKLEASIIKTEDHEKEFIESEILLLTKQKESLEQRGEALKLAIKTLGEASDEIQKKYIPVMNKVFNNIFSKLTNNKYSDVRAGENLSIMLSDPKNEIIVPSTILSSGTLDQIYLALRIAISETVLKINESLPLIMDEPFSQYDDERIDNAIKCIYDISEKQQVIFFTCKLREVEQIKSKYPCQVFSLT